MINAPVFNRGCTIVDSTGKRIATVDDPNHSLAVATALNNFLNNNTRKSDPITSLDAERMLAPTKRNRYRRLALDFYMRYGAMTDERLYDHFVEGQVKLSQDRVEHIRLELERLGMIEQATDMTATNRNGSNVRVFRLVSKSAAQHD